MRKKEHTNTRRSIYSLLFVLLLVFAGCSTSNNDSPAVSAPTSPSSPAPATQCAVTNLTASFASHVPGQMIVALKNGKASECSLSGVPTVQLTNKTDTLAASPEQASSDARNVNIAPNNSAYFTVTFTNPTDGSKCSPGERLTIAPPGNTETLILPVTLGEIPSLCSGSTATVSPVRSIA